MHPQTVGELMTRGVVGAGRDRERLGSRSDLRAPDRPLPCSRRNADPESDVKHPAADGAVGGANGGLP